MTHAEENNILRKTIREQSKKIERLNKKLTEYEGDFTANKQIKYLCENYIALQSKFDKLAEAARDLVNNPVEKIVIQEKIIEKPVEKVIVKTLPLQDDLNHKLKIAKQDAAVLRHLIREYNKIAGVSIRMTVDNHRKQNKLNREVDNNDSNRTS